MYSAPMYLKNTAHGTNEFSLDAHMRVHRITGIKCMILRGSPHVLFHSMHVLPSVCHRYCTCLVCAKGQFPNLIITRRVSSIHVRGPLTSMHVCLRGHMCICACMHACFDSFKYVRDMRQTAGASELHVIAFHPQTHHV